MAPPNLTRLFLSSFRYAWNTASQAIQNQPRTHQWPNYRESSFCMRVEAMTDPVDWPQWYIWMAHPWKEMQLTQHSSRLRQWRTKFYQKIKWEDSQTNKTRPWKMAEKIRVCFCTDPLRYERWCSHKLMLRCSSLFPTRQMSVFQVQTFFTLVKLKFHASELSLSSLINIEALRRPFKTERNSSIYWQATLQMKKIDRKAPVQKVLSISRCTFLNAESIQYHITL